MGTLRLLFIFLIIYLAWQGLKKYIFPLLLQRAAKKMQSTMQEKMNQQFRQQQQAEKAEGEVHIEYSQPKNKQKSSSDDLGEYVDFEEVD